MCLYYGAVCSIMLQKTDSHILKAILLKDGSECKSVMILYSQTQTNASRHIAALLSLKKKNRKHIEIASMPQNAFTMYLLCAILHQDRIHRVYERYRAIQGVDLWIYESFYVYSSVKRCTPFIYSAQGPC